MKKLIAKISLFTAIFIAMQFIAVPLFFRFIPVYQNHPAHRLKYRIDRIARQKALILLFGDSVFKWAAQKDTDCRSLDEIISDSLSEFTVGTIDHPAYQLDMYDAYCSYAVRKGYRFPIVVFEVNLSSFQPYLDRYPAFQFDETKMILQNEYLYHALYRPFMVFKYSFASISNDEFLGTPVFFLDSLVGAVRQFEAIRNSAYTYENQKRVIMYRYLGRITSKHGKIAHAAHAARLLTQAKMKPVFVIFPVDYQTAESFYPGIFTKSIKAFAAVIIKEVSAAGGTVIDLSTFLSEDKFDWKGINYIEEHLNQAGRLAVADTIAKILRPLAQSAQNKAF